MENKKYKRLLIDKLKQFRRPGEQLKIVDIFVTKPKLRVSCELCGWPKTSEVTKQLGLKYVYILQNTASQAKLSVGSKCVTTYQNYIQESEPNFKIINIEIVYTPTQSEHGEYYDIDEYYDEDIFKEEEYYKVDAYSNEEIVEEEEYRMTVEEETLKELDSDETYNYYFSDDDYDDIKRRK